MIEIHGTRTSEDEYEAAVELREAFLREFPVLQNDPNRRIHLVVSAKTPKHRRIRDIDLVLLARFEPPIEVRATLAESGAQTVRVYSLACTIEVKNHRAEDIRVRDNKLETRYKGEWTDDAWEQADQQKFALQARLEEVSGRKPYITGYAWLRQVSREQLYQAGARDPHPYLHDRFSLSDFCRKVFDLDSPHQGSGGRWSYGTLHDSDDVDAAVRFMTREEVLSGLDRKRIEEISKREVAQQRFDRLGSAQYLITGPGGTGKTVYLLRLAQRLYDERHRVLILTYNNALVTDLRRQLRFIGLRDDSSERAVRVQTLHAFFLHALIAFRLVSIDEVSDAWFDRDYSIAVEILVATLREMTRAQIDSVVARNFVDLGWSYVCVDEGQDWSDHERDALHLLYGHEHCIIADGNDQLVRQQSRCVWKATPAIEASTDTIPLKKSLRMKNRLATFANRLAQRLGMSEWSVDPELKALGGQVILLLTPPERHLGLILDRLRESEATGHKPLDALFCVPHEDVLKTEDGARYSKLGAFLQGNGVQVWDAVEQSERINEPDSIEQVRIVQYDSCRGLEGWLVVAKDFDLFYETKSRQWKPPAGQQSWIVDEKTERGVTAARWSMIPVTRAIDTLVISFYDRSSTIARAMLDVAETMRDSVVVIE